MNDHENEQSVSPEDFVLHRLSGEPGASEVGTRPRRRSDPQGIKPGKGIKLGKPVNPGKVEYFSSEAAAQSSAIAGALFIASRGRRPTTGLLLRWCRE